MADNLTGATTAIFTVSLSVAVAEPVDVAWSTKDGTAKAGTDYEAANGVVTFQPGELNKQIEVTVYGANAGATGDKKFYIKLNPPTNAVLVNSLIDCTITVTDESGIPVTSIVVAQGKRGLKGDPGMSAYEHAVLMGYQGTVEQWMEDQASAALAAERAQEAVGLVEAAASRAEAASASAAFAGKIYPTPEAGVDPVTGAANNSFYNVRSTSGDSYIDEYQNVNGVPVSTGKTYPSGSSLAAVKDAIIDPSKGVAVAEKVFNSNGTNLEKLTHALFANTYYAELEGLKNDNTTDNYSAWVTLNSKLNHGDIVVFRTGTYYFSQPIDIDKVVIIQGQLRTQGLGTVLRFASSGVRRKNQYITFKNISIHGTKTSVEINFDSRVFGNVGLKDVYDSSAMSSGSIDENVFVVGFDINYLVTQEGQANWGGAYREHYNMCLRSGRYGLVALDGVTHDVFHGGIISANDQGGVWSEAKLIAPNKSQTYNNLEFFGVTTEGNGREEADFLGDITDYYLNFYSGANSKVSVFGGYSEKANNMAENGGSLNFYGSHQHSNSKGFARNATITDAQGFGPYYNTLQFNNKLHNLFSANTGAATTYVNATSNAMKVTSSANGTVQVATPTIGVRTIQNKNLKGVKVAYRYKFNSGFGANTELLVQPIMRLLSSTAGRTDGNIINRNFPNKILQNSYGQAHTVEFYIHPRFGESQYLDKDGLLSGVQLILQVKNGLNDPNFSAEALEMEIDSVEVTLIADTKFTLSYDLAKTGTTAARPVLTVVDSGFYYFDTTLQRGITWNGTAWVENRPPIESSNTAAMSAIGNAINTTNKYTRFVYNTTNGKIYFPTNSTAASAWRATDGSGDIVPA